MPKRSSAAVAHHPSHQPVNVKLLLTTVIAIAILAPSGYLWYRFQLKRTAAGLLDRATRLETDEQWSLAAAYVQQYLQLVPDNATARIRWAQDFARSCESPAQRRRLCLSLYETLGLVTGKVDPKVELDLRIQLADNLYQSFQYDAAIREARKALEAPQTAQDAKLATQIRRTIGLAAAAILSEPRPDEVIQAREELDHALTLNPTDLDLVVAKAGLLRKYFAELGLTEENAHSDADKLMDELVAALPNDVRARLQRHRYRMAANIPLADDLSVALQLDPTNIEAQLLQGEQWITQDDVAKLEQAEVMYGELIRNAPTLTSAYVGRFQSLWKLGRQKEATETLKAGFESVSGNEPQIGMMLAEALLNDQKLDEASSVLARVDEALARISPNLELRTRFLFDAHADVLAARIQAARGNYTPAIAALKRITLAADEHPEIRKSDTIVQATDLLAQIMEQIGRWDIAAQQRKRLADSDPANMKLRLLAADALLNAGQIDDAYRELTLLPTEFRSQQAYASLELQILVAEQLRLSPPDRNWGEIESRIAWARTTFPRDWRFGIMQAELVGKWKQEDVAAGHAVIAELESEFSEEKQFWEAAMRVYGRMGNTEAAHQAYARFEQLETNVTARVLHRASLLALQGDFAAAEESLVRRAGEVRGEELQQVTQQRVQLALAQRDLPRLISRVDDAIARRQMNASLLTAAISIALEERDFATATRWEEALQGLNSPDTFMLSFLRLQHRILAEGADNAVRQEIDRELAALRTERPSWYPIVALSGYWNELIGDQRAAISDYELAVRLGDLRVATLERLYLLLVQTGRYDDAQNYAARLSSDSPASARVESMAIEAAVRSDQLDKALQLAVTGVEKNANDPLRHIWLADVHVRKGMNQEAGDILRKAYARFPSDPRIILSLVGYLRLAGGDNEAKKLLDQLHSDPSIPHETRAIVYAQGLQAIGDLPGATKAFEEAHRLVPSNIEVRLALAGLKQSSDIEAARALLESTYKLAPQNPEVRRQLAMVLSLTADKDDWSRINELLADDKTGSSSAAQTNYQVRAVLLLRRSGSPADYLRDIEAAERIVSEHVARAGWSSVDRQLMAEILERKAVLSRQWLPLESARAQLQVLASADSAGTADLLRYVEFLTRHSVSSVAAQAAAEGAPDLQARYLEEASRWVARLSELADGKQTLAASILAVRYQARLLHLTGKNEEAERVIQEYRTSREKEIKSETEKIELLRTVGELFVEQELFPQAVLAFRELAAISPNSFASLLNILLKTGEIDEATTLAMDRTQQMDTVSRAIIMSQVLAVAGSRARSTPAIDELIAGAVRQNGTNPDLLSAVGVMFASRGDLKAAETIFRKALTASPNNSVIMNNLATILADSSQAADQNTALELVDKAMRLEGRNKALLDTRGTILLNQGDVAGAVEHFLEATATVEPDPRYLLHLAIAEQRMGKSDSARTSLDEARSRGLGTSILTELDKKNLSELLKSFGLEP